MPTWKQLQKHHMMAAAPAFPKPRLADTEKRYALLTQRLEKQHLTLRDYILDQYPALTQDKIKSLPLVPNPFPYHISSATGTKISHWVYWIHPRDKRHAKTLLNEALTLARKKGKPGDEITVFQNRKKDRSIPQIRHIHVLIKHQR